jgi:hypothetical protein
MYSQATKPNMSRNNNQQGSAQEVIRASNERLGLKQWGFVIYRCMYTSQQKWDTFLSLLQNETQQFLRNDNDKDLLDTLVWTVVEDKKSLDGVDYKEARKIHDKWVGEELKKETEEGRERKDFPGFYNQLEKFFARVSDQPRYEFFIYADEEVVDSVVDAHEANDRNRQGGYFIKLVRTDLVAKDELEEGEEEDEEKAYEDEDDQDWRRNIWQKFKAWDIVRLYASILRGGWPDHHLGMSGVCDIMGL